MTLNTDDSVYNEIRIRRTSIYKSIKEQCPSPDVTDLIELLLQCDAEISEPAYFDHLTGLRNRAAFDLQLSNEIERAKRYGRIFSLALFDLDHFKSINDRFGHPMGDKVLIETAGILNLSLRRSDGIFRFGGDEFAAICPETSGTDAQTIMNRIENGVTTTINETNVTIGISCGISSFPDDSLEYESLISIADKRLYQCKKIHHQ